MRQFIEEQGHDGWVVQVEGNSPMLLFLDEDYHLYSCPAGQAVDAAAKASCKKNAAGFIGALLDVSDAGALYCARTSHTVSNPDGHVGSICVSQADFKWSFPDPANPEATLTHQIRVGVPVYILMERATETTLMAADLRSVKLRPSP
ncbi:MAG: hypothetical protein ABS92_09095 [Thiobacillus sp. SCN 63-374]|nr:MAG: hypothetical protein ABS92_09095 [Thiobacillus sp. SCN 63-374]